MTYVSFAKQEKPPESKQARAFRNSRAHEKKFSETIKRRYLQSVADIEDRIVGKPIVQAATQVDPTPVLNRIPLTVWTPFAKKGGRATIQKQSGNPADVTFDESLEILLNEIMILSGETETQRIARQFPGIARLKFKFNLQNPYTAQHLAT